MRTDAQRLLQILFLLIWALALIHIAAEQFYWYWTYRWFDIPMHLMGGVWLGMASLWFVYHSDYAPEFLTKVSPLLVALIGGLGAGTAWEFYEYGVWQLTQNGLPLRYLPDTALDILMDFFGAVTGYILYKRALPQTRTTPA